MNQPHVIHGLDMSAIYTRDRTTEVKVECPICKCSISRRLFITHLESALCHRSKYHIIFLLSCYVCAPLGETEFFGIPLLCPVDGCNFNSRYKCWHECHSKIVHGRYALYGDYRRVLQAAITKTTLSIFGPVIFERNRYHEILKVPSYFK